MSFEIFDPADVSPMSGSQNAYDVLATGTGTMAGTLKSYATIKRLSSSCTVYKYVDDYVRNSCDTKTATVQRVFHVRRYGDADKIKENFRILLWHGTSPSAIPGIIKTGFRMGTGGLFGGGIYFADRIAKSLGYTSRNGSGIGYLIIAEVFPGKVYKAHHFHSDFTTAPVGFDSVKGNGSNIPTWKHSKDYNGAIFPCGPTRRNPRQNQYDMPWNEYVIYDPDRIIIRFVVEVKF